WRRNIPLIYWQQFWMLRGPFCRESIQRALRVVFLVCDHPANPNNQIIQTLGCRPEITDTYASAVEIWMEYRPKHSALRSAAGISKREIDLHDVGVALQDVTSQCDIKSFNVVRKPISFRWHSSRAADLDERPILETTLEYLVIKFESANSR